MLRVRNDYIKNECLIWKEKQIYAGIIWNLLKNKIKNKSGLKFKISFYKKLRTTTDVLK